MTSTDLLTTAAEHLRPLLHEVTFVGGQVAPLLMTVPVITAPRPTNDVELTFDSIENPEKYPLESRRSGDET